jgi:hypothetical protein
VSNRDALRKEIESVPDPLIGEVLDFIAFLKVRRSTKHEEALVSEPLLAKEWLTPEEDKAWANL